MSLHSFSKSERLKSHTVIQRLFSEGKSFSSFPIRLVYIFEPSEAQDFAIKFAATVPKKKFPKAVDRNRIRRQIKEAFRLSKNHLYNDLSQLAGGTLSLMFIYTAPEKQAYSKIERSTEYLLNRLIKNILSKNSAA